MTIHEDTEIYAECEHENPDDSEEYTECEESATPHSSCAMQKVKCRDYTVFLEASDWWHENHFSGEGLHGSDGTYCKLNPMGTFCRECSEDSGDWVPHAEPEMQDCGALIRPARMHVDPEPAEYCENQVEVGEGRCPEHEDQDDE